MRSACARAAARELTIGACARTLAWSHSDSASRVPSSETSRHLAVCVVMTRPETGLRSDVSRSAYGKPAAKRISPNVRTVTPNTARRASYARHLYTLQPTPYTHSTRLNGTVVSTVYRQQSYTERALLVLLHNA